VIVAEPRAARGTLAGGRGRSSLFSSPFSSLRGLLRFAFVTHARSTDIESLHSSYLPLRTHLFDSAAEERGDTLRIAKLCLARVSVAEGPPRVWQ